MVFCLDEDKCGWIGKEEQLVPLPDDHRRESNQGPLVCPQCMGPIIFEVQVRQARDERKRAIQARRFKKVYHQSDFEDFYRYEPI